MKGLVLEPPHTVEGEAEALIAEARRHPQAESVDYLAVAVSVAVAAGVYLRIGSRQAARLSTCDATLQFQEVPSPRSFALATYPAPAIS